MPHLSNSAYRNQTVCLHDPRPLTQTTTHDVHLTQRHLMHVLFCIFIVHRPFRVPLSTWGCVIWLIPTFGSTFFILSLASYKAMFYSFVSVIFGVVIHMWRVRQLSPVPSPQFFTKLEQLG